MFLKIASCRGNISNHIEFTKKNSSSSSQSIQEQSSSLQTFKKADIVGTTILDQLSDRNESFVTCKRKSNITQWFSRKKSDSTKAGVRFKKKNSSYHIFAIFFLLFLKKPSCLSQVFIAILAYIFLTTVEACLFPISDF